MLRFFYFIHLCIFFVSTTAYSITREYEAPLVSSMWAFTKPAKKSCKLTHDIPFYGKAEFVNVEGSKQKMNFSVTLKRNQPTLKGMAIIKSVAPKWKPEKPTIYLGTTAIKSSHMPLMMKDTRAWRLLTELEQGMNPTFSYDGWIDGSDKVKVSLSTVRFFDAYDQFLGCLAQLPVPKVEKTFAENNYKSIIHFKSNKSFLTPKAGKKLEEIYAYVKSNNIDLILISGHTDSQGAHPYNETLGKKRAMAVSEFFTKSGISPNKIKIQSYGERKPIDNNKTDKGRAKNRRVLIKVI